MTNEQRHVLVTGAAEGVGRSIARTLAKDGARVVIADIRSADETIRLIREDGSAADQLHCDVSSEASVREAVAAAAELLGGRIDVLVNNAGMNGHYHLLEGMPLEEWEETLRINLTGTMLVTRETIPHLAAQGATIVNIASNVGKRGLPYRGDYVASKWALIGLTQTMALELAPRGIRVNAVCPGPIEGNRIEDVMQHHADVEGTTVVEMRAKWEAEAPLGRFVTPEEVASVVGFLAGEQSSAMTGQAINVTAGLVMH
ncbi:SDR family NAD(P)-dependent oxidoreductase [Microbacterium sp.]|jgi:NAD(P)-dependent dehydrogenase (short-subunit alcohol dehydrogenase family)|uniref:SDR family NAD(P)-dependent oxidoreductase n=1 Tax=Microbacterium sp. TaxID=51671 RepID=UPI0037C9AA61